MERLSPLVGKNQKNLAGEAVRWASVGTWLLAVDQEGLSESL
jgi:hypothetical protein